MISIGFVYDMSWIIAPFFKLEMAANMDLDEEYLGKSWPQVRENFNLFICEP